MENIICAEKDANVSKVNVKAGDIIAYGDVVIEYA